MIEFTLEESKLGMKDVHCYTLAEDVLKPSKRGEIAKNKLLKIYQDYFKDSYENIRFIIDQDFFTTDNTRQKYDVNRIMIFNLLYSGGEESEKIALLL